MNLDLIIWGALDFEKLVLNIFESLGLFGILTPVTGDGGVDIYINDPNGVVIIQCKKYDAKTSIGSKEIREFLGSLIHQKAIHGFFITTSSYSEQAIQFCKDHDEITLIDGKGIKQLFRYSMIPYLDKYARENNYLLNKEFKILPIDVKTMIEVFYDLILQNKSTIERHIEIKKEINGLYGEYIKEVQNIISKYK